MFDRLQLADSVEKLEMHPPQFLASVDRNR
jgi:hypothetical protein